LIIKDLLNYYLELLSLVNPTLIRQSTPLDLVTLLLGVEKLFPSFLPFELEHLPHQPRSGDLLACGSGFNKDVLLLP
jgi:hypothetical protein